MPENYLTYSLEPEKRKAKAKHTYLKYLIRCSLPLKEAVPVPPIQSMGYISSCDVRFALSKRKCAQSESFIYMSVYPLK